MESFVSKWAADLSVAEHTCLRRGCKRDRHGMACFYMLTKVHKNPHTFRPVVATCGTVLLILSSWLDYKLKQLLPFVEACTRNSSDLRSKMNNLGKLPRNARLVTADATSTHTGVNAEHGLSTLRGFLEELESNGSLPQDFNIEMATEAAALVMH